MSIKLTAGQREALNKIVGLLEEAKGVVDELWRELEAPHAERKEKFEARSDKWRESDKGQEAEAALEAESDALTALEEWGGRIEELASLPSGFVEE
jgi:hypothetical protein